MPAWLRKSLFAAAGLYLLFAAWWVVAAGFARNEFLLNVACDPTRELWRDVNKAFADEYERTEGVRLFIRQSHGGSGSQARALADGLQGDVATLALFTDTDQLRKVGLLAPDWVDRLPNRSLPYTSTIVFVVRKGNPKGVRDWPDLARDGVGVVTPSPKTSGNGKWSFLAMWGSAARRGATEQEAYDYVERVYRRVTVLDLSARSSTMTFAQKKIGDVHLTWENEAYLEVAEANGALEIVYPPVSVLAEPHVAVVDAVVDRKGTRAAAEAYLRFLYTEAGQEIIAKHYHRPTDPAVLARHADRFPPLDLFSVRDLGPSWDAVNKKFFADGGAFDRMTAAGRGP